MLVCLVGFLWFIMVFLCFFPLLERWYLCVPCEAGLDPNDVEMQENRVREVTMAIRVGIFWLLVFAGTGLKFVLSVTKWMLESEQEAASSVVELSLQ